MADNTIKINVEVDDRPVKSLKAELRETIQQLQQTELGTEAFDKLNQKAAALKDRMAEVNEQVAVFATGSKYEQVSNSLGEIGAGLRDMDFDRVTNGAKLFAQTSKSITFKDAIGSLKQMGSAFVSIGKTILTNPLFLIVAVVGAIIAAVIALLDELGILKVIFKAVGDAIGWVIQQLKDFLDWIGLTSYAAEDAAAKQAEAQEKIAQSHADKRAKVTDAYDHEIRLAQIAGENTVEMERQKQYAIIETSREEIAALRLKMESLKIAGTLTKEKSDEIRAAITELKTGIREASQEIQVINATEVADNKAANEKKAADNKAASDKRKADREQEKADRLAASRMIQDAELDLMKEGIEKERKEQNLKYERLIQDTLANKKLEQDEKDKLEIALKEQQHNALKAIDQKYLDETNEALKVANENKAAKQKEYDEKEKAAKVELNAIKNANDLKAQLALLDAQREEELKNVELTESEKALIEEKYRTLKSEKEKELSDAAVKAAEEEALKKAAIQQNYTDSVVALSEGIFAVSNSLGKQDEKSKEERAKRQFNIQKAMNLAMAVIDGHKAITASLAAAPVAILGVPNPVGIASLTFAIATTASNIAKIASARFGGSGGGGGGGAASGGGGGGAMPSMGGIQQGSQTPQMNLNNSQEQTAQSNSKRDKVMVVDYHDIQNKGNELQMMNNKVTLA
jgi:hypothetical protein